jgi:hypothetical protein
MDSIQRREEAWKMHLFCVSMFIFGFLIIHWEQVGECDMPTARKEQEIAVPSEAIVSAETPGLF